MGFLPKLPRVVLELEGRPLCADIAQARSFFARLRGLIRCGPLSPGQALLIAPCNSVHTLGMGGPIEAVFLSKDLRVLKISRALKPWRGASGCLGAWGVLEWRVGESSRLGLRAGAQLKQTNMGPSLQKEARQ
jgi:uncharacterized membrane protein (UPF0127 family)